VDPLRRSLPDAPDFLDGKIPQECADVFLSDLELAVRFSPIAGDLGEKLVGGDSGGGGEFGFFPNAFPDLPGDGRGDTSR
jgi:hypothetical protein